MICGGSRRRYASRAFAPRRTAGGPGNDFRRTDAPSAPADADGIRVETTMADEPTIRPYPNPYHEDEDALLEAIPRGIERLRANDAKLHPVPPDKPIPPEQPVAPTE
jgi:hypothetical protein